MCYASSVMLSECCSCTISERPTPSSTLKTPLSLTIPVDPEHSPVSPIIPVHTQKQGGVPPSSNMTNRSIPAISPARSSSQGLSAAGHCNRHKEKSRTVNCRLTTVNCLYPLCRPIAALQSHIRLFFAKARRQPLSESTLSKLYENKRLYPPLESALLKNRGEGTSPKTPFPTTLSFLHYAIYTFK